MTSDETLRRTLVLGWRVLETSPGLTLVLSRDEECCRPCFPAGLVRGNLNLDLDGGAARRSFLCFGYDLSTFADELERLRRQLEGAAEFANQEESVRLVFSVSSPGRGRLVVGGEVVFRDGSGDDEILAGVLPRPGARLAFDGLVCEQSYLPGLVRDIREFLRDGLVCLVHPMLQ